MIPVGKIPWSRAWQPTQYSCLENPVGRGAWRATVHGVARSWTQLKGVSTTQGQLNSTHSMDENILVHRSQRETRKKEKMRGRDKAGEKEEGLKGKREGKTKTEEQRKTVSVT